MSNIYDKASLVLIPSGTKTSKVYSQKPVSGDGDFTFSRSTAATRVNEGGAIEKETQNLLLQSNTFDTTWSNTSTIETSGQSGYDGSNDAWLLTATHSTDVRIQQAISFSGVHTISIYAKAGTADFVELVTIGGSNPRAWFNLSTGLVGTSYNIIDTNIESVGSGWYRCSITTNESISSYRIYLSDADNSTAVTNGAYIYIQDAQVERGLVARDYIETTTAAVEGGITDNVPRLDYTDSSCPALLLEPSRRNAMPQSEYISTADFSVSANVVFTNNYAVSPEGVENATRVQFGATGSNEIFYDRGVGNYGKKNTTSFYVKGTSGQTINTYIDGTSSTAGYYFFQKDVTLTGDWQRVENTFDLPLNAGTSNFVIRRRTTDSATEILLYGYEWQVDTAGGDASYATSYIPTYGSSVTRNAEGAEKTGVSSLIGQSEGTLFVEYNSNISEDDSFFLVADDGSADNRIVLYSNVPNKLALVINNGGVLQVVKPNIPLASGTNKFAVGYANNDVVLYLNGTQVASDNTASIPNTSALRIGKQHTGVDVPSGKGTKQALVFPTRLSNEELADLTTI